MGVTDPQPLGGVVDGGTRPRLLQGPPGQQLGLLTYNLSQFFETLNEVNGTVSVGSAIGVPANVTYATRGARTLAWGPRGGSVELFTDWGSAVTSFLQPMPRCAALKGGQFWFGPISGTVQWTMGETAGVPAFATGGATFSGQGQHCYAVRPIHDTVVVGYNAVDGGQRLMTVEPPFVDLVAPQPGTGSPLVTPLGSSLLVSWVEPPRVKGFVLAFDGGVTPITIDDKAVDGREHWAASSSNGAAAIVWQAFDVASGRVLVNARIVVEPTAPSTTVDGGFDAGVASPDAGPGDAGSTLPDAGSTLPDAGPPPPDAGPADSGTGDAGEGDAGVRDGGVDAGAGDAGSSPDGGTPDAGADAGAASVDGGGLDAGPGDGSTFVPVCGCTSSSGAPVLLLAVMFLRRRRHATR
ncbi:MAG: hypothetical protein GQE15_31600 [Archangiaceae bacterium]|nr:hypothetical protein [Archangiaceae bacterium]